MMNVTLRDMFAHMENKYGVLNQSDFNLIFERLETVKSPTQENFIETFIASSLEPVKSLLSITKLSTSPMPSTMIPPVCITRRISSMYAYAIEFFYRSFPTIPDRLFEERVEIINLHAPTILHRYQLYLRLL